MLVVDLYVITFLESLVAERTAGLILQPRVNAVLVKDMKTTQHPANRDVLHWFQTYHTLLHEVLSILHPNKAKL